jgi:hypothetical protein
MQKVVSEILKPDPAMYWLQNRAPIPLIDFGRKFDKTC